jgi:hypothetical protein
VPDQAVDEGALLAVVLGAADPDIPANGLTFAFVGSPPEGATLDPVTGAVHGTPSEAQGPATHTITVRVTDDGIPPLSDTNSLTVVVAGTSEPLKVTARVTEGGTVTLSWNARAGKDYSVQYKANLQDAEWLSLPTPAGMDSVTDTLTGERQRYYRIVELPPD